MDTLLDAAIKALASFLTSAYILPAAFIGILLTALLYLRLERKHTYNFKRNIAELETVRSDLEQKVYILTERLAASDDRWKDINHLLLAAQTGRESSQDQPVYSPFFESLGIKKEEMAVDGNLAFVLTPFHKKYEGRYHAIKEVCSSLGFECKRGDEEFVEGLLLPHIIKLLLKAAVVIANIDGRNPNVFYELGIAHAIGKKTILVSSEIDQLPFDIRAKKVVISRKTLELQEKLSNELASLIEQV